MSDAQVSQNREDKLQGKGAILGHPIHPILVDFPIAFLVAVLLSDIAYAVSTQPFWARLSFYGLAAGILVGVLAAIFGLIDFLSVAPAREHFAGWAHLIGNVIVILIAIVNVWLRFGNMEESVVPLGLILSAVTGLLLVITGWYGGSLVFKHRIGTADH